MSTPTSYTPPVYSLTAFNCSVCGAYAKQQFGVMAFDLHGRGTGMPIEEFSISMCAHCNTPSLWHGHAMVYPISSSAPLPNPDLPDDIKSDYEEARVIFPNSPRGSAALLRLAIQKLCKHLGEPGKNIDTDVAALVKKGLPQTLQQAMDTLRVVGNESVHPGKLDVRDDPVLAAGLFRLVNIIAEKLISEPKEIAQLYSTLPTSKLDGIARRDGTPIPPLS